jgi:mono/diheme cytochrome c family protein
MVVLVPTVVLAPAVVLAPNAYTSIPISDQEEVHMRKLLLLLTLLALVGLVACNGEEAPAPAAGDPDAGEQVFNGGASPACNTCHSLEPGEVLAGPSLANIGAEAGNRVDGMSAAAYLREAVVDPNAYLAEGFGSGIMPATYGGQLSEEEIENLVAYMLTLE